MKGWSKTEKPYDPAELQTFVGLAAETRERAQLGRVYLKIMGLTGWSVRRLHARISTGVCISTLHKIVNASATPNPPKADKRPITEEPSPKIVAIPVSPMSGGCKAVFDHLCDAAAAMARIQQIPSNEIVGALTNEDDQRRFKLAIRQVLEQAEIIDSLVSHCERCSQPRSDEEYLTRRRAIA